MTRLTLDLSRLKGLWTSHAKWNSGDFNLSSVMVKVKKFLVDSTASYKNRTRRKR